MKKIAIVAFIVLASLGGLFAQIDSVQVKKVDAQAQSSETDKGIDETVSDMEDYAVEERVLRKHKEKGGYFSVDFQGNIKGKDRTRSGFVNGVRIGFGVQINKFLSLGAGVGVDNYEPSDAREKFIPIFVELKSYPLGKDKYLMLAISAGHGGALPTADYAKNATGELCFYPEVGVIYPLPHTIANIYLSIGFKTQKGTFTYHTYETFTTNRSYNRLSVKLGIQFQ